MNKQLTGQTKQPKNKKHPDNKEYLEVEDYTKEFLYGTFPIFNNPLSQLKSEQLQNMDYIKKDLPKNPQELNLLLFKSKKISTPYYTKVYKVMQDILAYFYIKETGERVVIPHNTKAYAVLQHPYFSYESVKDGLQALQTMNIISKKIGNKKMQSNGFIKNGHGQALYSKAGYMTEITLLGETYELKEIIHTASGIYRDRIQLNYEPVKNSEIVIHRKHERKNIFDKKFVRTKKIKIQNNKSLQEELDTINDYTRKWGYHYNNQHIKYKIIFSGNTWSGGRLYSTFQSVNKKHRYKVLPMNFVESDFTSSIPNISYLLMTGKIYDIQKDIYSDVIEFINPEINSEKLSKKLYRQIVKTPLLICFNSNFEKSIKATRYSLSMAGLNYNQVYKDIENKFKIPKSYLEGLVNVIKTDKFGGHPRLDLMQIKRSLFSKIIKQNPEWNYMSLNQNKLMIKFLSTIQKQFDNFLIFCKKNQIKRSLVNHYLFTPEQLIDSIQEVHSVLKPLFFNPKIGKNLIYIESQILLNVFKECIKEGIPVISIHDAFYSSKKHKEDLELIMSNSQFEVCNLLRFEFLNFVNKQNQLIKSKSLVINKILKSRIPSLLDIRVKLMEKVSLVRLIGLIKQEMVRLQGEWDYVAIH